VPADIREQFTAAGFGHIPLVADIHFLPSAAMEAVEHVEKVRVNPGNYADKKKFAVKEYTDADYELELERLHEAFSPLVLRAKALGRALRIGTNHGSLSDRIMNRYGDTPLGMVESALEFLRIGESHGYRQMVLSMKASNPKVMIQAYRLLVQRMDEEDMHYPLHLGVTEAGDGEDGRIKSAIGIGSLLLDGLGDTIRVSLTEDSVYEIPVAKAIADKAMSLWKPESGDRKPDSRGADGVDPYHFAKRETAALELHPGLAIGPELPPRVVVRSGTDVAATLSALGQARLQDTPPEILLVPVNTVAEAARLPQAPGITYALELAPALTAADLELLTLPAGTILVRDFGPADAAALTAFATFARAHSLVLAAALPPTPSPPRAHPPPAGRRPPDLHPFRHPVSPIRYLARPRRLPPPRRNPARPRLGRADLDPQHRRPRRCGRSQLSVQAARSLLPHRRPALRRPGRSRVSIETEPDPVRATRLAYNVLQGAGARISKTEFVACPSCGRTLFDLQSTTQRIRAQTGHLKGVKLAIMGCIVNGPGEMADADFGYVGGAPGKINLYVGKTCVQYNIPQAEADARLIALIKEHGKWADPT
jgi:(E)-4-hydroxy-3-methylbut-2-enyl-diphosphate synthase